LKIPPKENEEQALSEIVAELGNSAVFGGPSCVDDDDYDQQGGNTEVA